MNLIAKQTLAKENKIRTSSAIISPRDACQAFMTSTQIANMAAFLMMMNYLFQSHRRLNVSSIVEILSLKVMYYHYYITPYELLIPAWADCLSMEFEWQQVTRILLDILNNLNHPVVWIILILPLIFNSFWLFPSDWWPFQVHPLLLVSPLSSNSTVFFSVPWQGSRFCRSFRFLLFAFCGQQ